MPSHYLLLNPTVFLTDCRSFPQLETLFTTDWYWFAEVINWTGTRVHWVYDL